MPAVRAYLIMYIRVPTISQILVYHIHFALNGCIHEFCSVHRPYLSKEKHVHTLNTEGQKRYSGSVFIPLLCM